jgi:hypothetical protein
VDDPCCLVSTLACRSTSSGSRKLLTRTLRHRHPLFLKRGTWTVVDGNGRYNHFEDEDTNTAEMVIKSYVQARSDRPQIEI